MLAVQALTMPVRCRRASSGAQRCRPMKPRWTDEADICESRMEPFSMPSGMAQTTGWGAPSGGPSVASAPRAGPKGPRDPEGRRRGRGNAESWLVFPEHSLQLCLALAPWPWMGPRCRRTAAAMRRPA